jgi:Flp pilus assembly protein TadD
MLQLFLVIITGFLPAQSPGSFLLRGTILAASAQAAEHADVVLESSQDRVVAKTLADGAGNFEFQNLEAGRYVVVVRVEGYEDAREPVELGVNVNESLLLAQQVAVADGQQPPPPQPEPSGAASVYVFLHKKASGAAENDPEFVALTELSRKYPKKTLQEYEKAVEFNRKGDSLQAIEHYEAVVKLAPDFYYGHTSLGVQYQKLGRYRDAEREYNLARKLNPQSDQPLLNLGKLFLQEADGSANKGPVLVGRILDQALDALEEATKLQPSAMAYYLLGTAYHRSEFEEEAESNLKRALELDGGMATARLTLADVYIRQEKWENALKIIDAYLTQNPNAPDRAQLEQVRVKVERKVTAVPK